MLPNDPEHLVEVPLRQVGCRCQESKRNGDRTGRAPAPVRRLYRCSMDPLSGVRLASLRYPPVARGRPTRRRGAASPGQSRSRSSAGAAGGRRASAGWPGDRISSARGRGGRRPCRAGNLGLAGDSDERVSGVVGGLPAEDRLWILARPPPGCFQAPSGPHRRARSRPPR